MTSTINQSELKEALKKQIEYYFSKQNLTHDSYLVSQMDHQMYVPLDVIVTFSKIKELTDDVELIKAALQNSKVCSLNADETGIKPNIKSERNTIILREIPSDTTTDEVRSIFEDANVLNVRSDVGDTWFVTMNTEEEAVATLLKLRTKKFHDAPIKARLKSENILRSFMPPTATVSNNDSKPSNQFTPGGYYPSNNYYQQNPNFQYHPQQQQQAYRGNNAYDPQRYGRRPAKSMNNGRYQQNFQQQQPAAAAVPSKERKNGSARKHKEKRSHKHEKKTAKKPVLNTTNFPPLPANATPTQGYATEYKSYREDDIMEVVKHMSIEDCELPEGKMDLHGHPSALNVAPHQDLLKSQRTYSIEQAREALRQGRPIRSDSVGSMDYESMMYGEEYTKEARAARASIPTTASVVPTVVAESPVGTKRTEPQQEPHPKKGGYAAALLSSPPAPVVATPAAASASSNRGKKKNKEDKKQATKAKKKEEVSPASSTKDSVPASPEEDALSPWAKRSFLDVLKTDKGKESVGSDVEMKPAAVSNNNQ